MFSLNSLDTKIVKLSWGYDIEKFCCLLKRLYDMNLTLTRIRSLMQYFSHGVLPLFAYKKMEFILPHDRLIF